MAGIRRLLIAGLAAACTPAFSQQPTLAHREAIADWHVAARSADDEADAAALTAAFSAFGRQFELAMEPNMRLRARSALRRRGSVAFTGSLRGRPDSWARIVVSAAGMPAGIIWDGEMLFGIEADVDGGESRIFRAADVIVPAGALSCGMHTEATSAATMFAELATAEPEIARAAGAALNLNIGLVADAGFSALHPDAAEAMLVRANNVDGLFSEQLGIQVTVAQSDVFPEPETDPFTETTVAADLLGEVAVYRGNNAAQDAQGLTHLFTGRDLDGSTVGIAYLGSVCARRLDWDPEGRSFGVGLTQANFGPGAAFVESLIAAHEIGHNFGAPHDGEPGMCANAPSGHIMSPSLSPATRTFSQCSIEIITADLSSATCLTPVDTVDVAIDGHSLLETILTETEFRYLVTVSNNGFDTAAGTTVELAVDPQFAIIAVRPQSGSCGPIQPNLKCELGDIPGASSRSIELTLRADAPGKFGVAGAVTNAADTRSQNDTFSDEMTVDPASDLALSSNPRTLELDELTTILVGVKNRSSITASNIVLTGTYSAGLVISAADYSGDACLVDGESRTLRCQISSLAGFEGGNLTISLLGVDAGSQTLSLDVSAAQADPDAANNSSEILLEIIGAPAPQPAQPTAQADGGGGAVGVITLVVLTGTWRRRRRLAHAGNANFS